MNLIDTHCHLTFEQFAGQVDAVVQRAAAAGVSTCITVGTTLEDSRKAIELPPLLSSDRKTRGRYDNIYATVAIHPHEAKSVDENVLAELRRLAQNKKVVAIGETGLDYHYNFSTPDQQQAAFKSHLQIAGEANLPVIIHSREAFDETMQILRQFPALKRVIFHCFSGSAEQAKVVLDAGYFVSFTGVVTFRSAEKTRAAALAVPPDRLMIETDAPYMSPEPMRKQKVNEPALLIHTARFLADLKGIPFDAFAAQTTSNAKSFFSLP